MANVFTAEEVVNLTRSQRERMRHPFTCGKRNDPDNPHPVLDGDNGVLVATVRGWICPFCDYTQGWAHPFMKEGTV